jgi:hypothetical protein
LGFVLGISTGLLPSELLVAVFVPLAVGYEWGIQAYTAFCVRLAVRHRYAFDAKGTVTDADDQRDDQVQALKITCVSLVLALVTTAIVVAVVG